MRLRRVIFPLFMLELCPLKKMFVEVLTPVAQTVMLFGNKVVTNAIKVILKHYMGVGLDGLWGPFHLYISLTLT